MNNQTDFLRKKFGPLKARNLKNAIAHQITTAFPPIGGPRICTLCAEMIMDVVSQHMRSRDHIKPGQLLWAAVDINDPPRRHRSTADTKLVPVLLDLSTADDVQGASTVSQDPNGCCSGLAACASRLTSKADCSPTATSPKCSTSTASTWAGSWPNTSVQPAPSFRDVPRFTMSDLGSLISTSFAGCATPAERTRT